MCLSKKFLVNFLVISIIGLVFFRPLFLKRSVEIEFLRPVLVDSVYYYHGFPIRTLVKDAVRSVNQVKEYNITIYSFKEKIAAFKVFSDVEIPKIENLGHLKTYRSLYAHSFFILYLNNENIVETLSFKIKARDYIAFFTRNNTTFNLKIDENYYKFELPYRNNQFYDINLRSPKNSYKFHISPESQEIIVKFKENMKNQRILIKLKPDYFKIMLNCLITLLYALTFSYILIYSHSIFLKNFSVIFTILLIYYLSYFPGIYDFDVWNELYQVYSRVSDWHTPFHTLTIAVILKIFHHIGAYVLIQIFFASVLFAWILKKLNVKNSLIIALLFSFPLTAIFLISAWKDTYFSLSIVWFSFLLHFAYNDDNYLKSKLNIISFVLSLVFIMLFRHNGILLSILCIVAMLFLLRRQLKRVLVISLLAISSFIILELFFYKVLRVERTPVFYQKDLLILSSYVANNFKFSEEERDLIRKTISFEDLRERRGITSLLWYGYFNWIAFDKDKDRIRRIIVRSIIKDVRPFIEHILQSSSYIYNIFSRVFVINYSGDFIELEIAKLYPDFKLPQIQNIIEKITDLPTKEKLFKFILLFYKPPIYFYFLIFIFLFNKELRIITIPSLFNSFIMFFISTISHFRFVYSNYLICIILVIYFGFKIINKYEKSSFGHFRRG